MTNAVVLLAIVLPAVAWFPLEWLFQHLSLGFPGFDCLFRVIILAVFALASLRVASLGTS